MKGLSFRGRVVGAVAALCVLAGGALAVPPVMPAVEFPVDTASIVTVCVTACAAILILIFGPTIGFKLVKKLAAWARRLI